MIRFVVCGSGWRAMFPVRLARLVPERFELVSLYTHTVERAKILREQGLPAVSNMDQSLSVPHDLVIVASGPGTLAKTLVALCARNERILSETSFLPLEEEACKRLWNLPVSVLEQYWYTPLWSSVAKVLPSIGRVDQVSLSGLHCHHAASIFRRIFQVGDEMPRMLGSVDFPSQCIKTAGRGGICLTGERQDYTRSLRVMRFERGLAVYDQSSNQYHSAFFGLHFEIRGEKGTITEAGVTMLDEHRYPMTLPFQFHTQRRFGNESLALTHVTVGNQTTFINTYGETNLDNDEIAIARMMELLMLGKDPYPIQEAIRDARLGKRFLANAPGMS